MPNGNDRPLTSADLAQNTGFSQRYIEQKMDKQRIDPTTVRRLPDGRIVAKTQGGANRILTGFDAGERGRRVHWYTYKGATNISVNTQDYPEIAEHGVTVYFPWIAGE